ncbi:LOW QUALITY PROTEIN: uncharacterized protein RCH25_043680 [Pelodytes ibericus]
MRRYTLEEPTDKYIFYDFECMQETGVHIPNYICAAALAGDDCWEFQGASYLEEFVTTFIDKPFSNYTFIAHNAGRYDSYFVVHQLLKEKIAMKLLAQGGKLLCVTIVDLGIRFIDSLNFLPMKLSKLPQALGFKGCKDYFPLFNTAQNQNYIGPMPSMDHYGYEQMMCDDKKEFTIWYQENQHCEFNFQAELKKYCIDDVNILKQACVCYRQSVLDMTKTKKIVKGPDGPEIVIDNIDPFSLTTLASVCMAMYRLKFLPKDTIALLPTDNYHKKQKRFSTKSIQWLMYVAHKEGITIQHALQGGEKAVGNYFLDGYALINGQPTAFEFQGCFYHGCPSCYNEKAFNPVTNTTYAQLHHKTCVRTHFLKRQGYVVREIWEHEWSNMLETDKDIQVFLLEKDFPQALNPVTPFTGAAQMLSNCTTKQLRVRPYSMILPVYIPTSTKQKDIPLAIL